MWRLSFTVFILLTSLSARAHSTWIKANSNEPACSATCSRAGLENVLGPTRTTSTCALELNHEFYPGTKPNTKKSPCYTYIGKGSSRKLVLGDDQMPSYCLCADDGQNKGSDYGWISSSAEHKSCADTCQDVAPKYSYAVYGSFTKAWLHVCSAKDGTIGYSESTVQSLANASCSATKSVDEPFGCLCTQMFSGDLDPDLDP